MKRIIFFVMVVLIASNAICVSAQKRKIPIQFKREQPGPIKPDIEYSLAIVDLPVEATIDDSTGYLEVNAPSDLSGTVYVYKVSGALERSSSRLNTTFPVPQTRQTHIVTIKGDDWSGEGKFVY